MDDHDILERIDALVREEDELRGQGAQRPLTSDEQQRVQRIEVALDQCWDLLRQRRARREFGQDPDRANVRDAETVERYQQ